MNIDKMNKESNFYHSKNEERLVKDILKIRIEDAEEELSNRIVVQHVDNMTNIPVFNAFSKKVLVCDQNGERVLINNHDEIRRQQMKNSGRLYEVNKQIETVVEESEDEFEFE